MADSAFRNKLETKRLALGPADICVGDPTVADGEGMLAIEELPNVTINLTPSLQMGQVTGGHQLARATFSRGTRATIDATLYDIQNAVLGTLLHDAEQPTETFSISAVNTDSVEVDDADATLPEELQAGDVFNVDGSESNDGTFTVQSVSDDGTGTTTITVQETLTTGDTDLGDVIHFVDGMLFKTETQALEPATMAIIPRDLKDGAINKPIWWVPRFVVPDFGGITFSDNEGEGANETIDITFKPLLADFDQSGVQLPDGARKIFKMPPSRIPGADLSWSLPSPYSGA